MTDNTNINCPDSILSLYKIFSSGNTMMYIHVQVYLVIYLDHCMTRLLCTFFNFSTKDIKICKEGN